jgi:hypothetical protein
LIIGKIANSSVFDMKAMGVGIKKGDESIVRFMLIKRASQCKKRRRTTKAFGRY